jgi:hypothetical protein
MSRGLTLALRGRIAARTGRSSWLLAARRHLGDTATALSCDPNYNPGSVRSAVCGIMAGS